LGGGYTRFFGLDAASVRGGCGRIHASTKPIRKSMSLSFKTALSIPLLFGLLTVVACGGKTDTVTGDSGGSNLPPEGSNAGECTDGADNDQDGDFDCNDTDCVGSPDCSEANTPGGCSDGADNDRDGLFDCDDPDCVSDEACGDGIEGNEAGECEDGKDNDGDGLIDCEDEDCFNFDGCDDYEGDEAGECSDEKDNDGDGDIDCDDEGCVGSPDCEEEPTNDIGSEENPGSSCKEILEQVENAEDGHFWIDPDGSGAFKVYCDMTSTDPGWMLLARYQSSTLMNWDHHSHQILGSANVNDPPLLWPTGERFGHIRFDLFSPVDAEIKMDCGSVSAEPDFSYSTKGLFESWDEGDHGTYGDNEWGFIGINIRREGHGNCGSSLQSGHRWPGIALCIGPGDAESYSNHLISYQDNHRIGCIGSTADQSRIWYRP
jgi:hypothetical protein